MTQDTLLLLAPLPKDLHDALAAEYTLVERADAAASQARIAVTTGMAGADAATMEALPALKLIASQGVGLDRIDLAAAARRGIAVCHTPDELTEDVADFAIGLMYAAARRIVEADRFVRSGRWSHERMGLGIGLSGKTLGVVGMGKIGRAVARRAAGLGMAVAWTGPNPKPELPWTFVPELTELAGAADVLVLVAPGGAATRHMVDAAVLAALGPRGILVNVARGSVVDEAALLAALEGRSIAGAGLDVFASEPDLDPRFLPLENVVLAPHYASLTAETRRGIIGRLLSDIGHFRAGRPFFNAAG
ncbi:2-hydroxyacid dehydrogenase [Roseomonas haemaphysalidis]|uniref:2-hydroxyacid dehydrogenase n=1 Tax=Roseomonas haemaphysalidis TaxID=2768162 RepID=A0ABS3KLP6_9PROT|nr:2-hydroxyacid dehydrogenase [Roseomonas haemaphysalidis]MBO1078372.1 2-hydroxyacid dehydrogenase [Roseomonas haemaphysalidis]